MKQVNVSIFRLTITEQTGPVEITNNGVVIGEYRPRSGQTVREAEPELAREIDRQLAQLGLAPKPPKP